MGDGDNKVFSFRHSRLFGSLWKHDINERARYKMHAQALWRGIAVVSIKYKKTFFSVESAGLKDMRLH